jgi:hypothetical protein
MRTTIHPSQLAVLPQNPTVEQAVEYMKTSMDIIDWNLKRRRVIRAVGRDVFLNHYVPSKDSYVSKIDCSGLCPRTIKGNKSTNHKPFNSYGRK